MLRFLGRGSLTKRSENEKMLNALFGKKIGAEISKGLGGAAAAAAPVYRQLQQRMDRIFIHI